MTAEKPEKEFTIKLAMTVYADTKEDATREINHMIDELYKQWFTRHIVFRYFDIINEGRIWHEQENKK